MEPDKQHASSRTVPDQSVDDIELEETIIATGFIQASMSKIQGFFKDF